MALKLQGPASSGDDGSAEIMADINITPLVDIFLVLLIIFMVTSSVMSQMGVDVSLPQASSASATSQPEGVIVTLLPNGGLKVNQDAVAAGDSAGLEARLGAAFKKTTSRLVVLEGDRKAFLGNAIQVMDSARKVGAQKFAIATAPDAEK